MTSGDAQPIVVVGGGTSGLEFISEFVKHSSSPVVLCEPGGIPDMVRSRRFFDVVTEEFTWPNVKAVLVEGQPGVPYLQARAFGGGSSINGMLNVSWTEGVISQTEIPQKGIGPVSRALLLLGGHVAPLSWSRDERINNVVHVQSLIESGRVTLVNAAVDSLVTDGFGVLGVVVGGQKIDARHVVLASGVLQSVKLLSQSDCSHLITGLGHNISDHAGVTFTVSLTEQADADVFDASVVVPLSLEVDGVAYRAVVIGYERSGHDDARTGLLSACLLSTKSKGWIEIPDSGVTPHLNLLSISGEKRAMREAVRQLLHIAQSRAIREISSEVFIDAHGSQVEKLANCDDEQLDQWIVAHLSPVSHLSGGCADPSVKAVKGLSVIDASTLEHVPDVLPNRIVAERARKVGLELGELFA